MACSKNRTSYNNSKHTGKWWECRRDLDSPNEMIDSIDRTNCNRLASKWNRSTRRWAHSRKSQKPSSSTNDVFQWSAPNTWKSRWPNFPLHQMSSSLDHLESDCRRPWGFGPWMAVSRNHLWPQCERREEGKKILLIYLRRVHRFGFKAEKDSPVNWERKNNDTTIANGFKVRFRFSSAHFSARVGNGWMHCWFCLMHELHEFDRSLWRFNS